MPDFPPVQPQGRLHAVFPDVHVLHGTVSMGPGVRIPRTMVVLVHEGELTVVNAVRPDEAGMAALAALGTVRHVVKIGMHGMDDPWFVDHYGADFWALPGVDPEGPPVTRRLVADEALPVPWLRLHSFRDTRRPEAALLADRDDGVLLTCDSVQNWSDLEGCSFLAKGVTLAMGFTKRPANIGPPWRRIQTPEGGSLEADFRRLLELPFDSLVGGHGKPLAGGAKAALTATVDALFG